MSTQEKTNENRVVEPTPESFGMDNFNMTNSLPEPRITVNDLPWDVMPLSEPYTCSGGGNLFNSFPANAYCTPPMSTRSRHNSEMQPQPSTSQQALNLMKNERGHVFNEPLHRQDYSSTVKNEAFATDLSKNSQLVNEKQPNRPTPVFPNLESDYPTCQGPCFSGSDDAKTTILIGEPVPTFIREDIRLWRKRFLRYCTSKNICDSIEQLEEAYLSFTDQERKELAFMYNMARDSDKPFEVFCERLHAKFSKTTEEIYEELTRMKVSQFPNPNACFQKLMALSTSVNLDEDIALSLFYGKFTASVAREIKLAHKDQPIERLGLTANVIYAAAKRAIKQTQQTQPKPNEQGPSNRNQMSQNRQSPQQHYNYNRRMPVQYERRFSVHPYQRRPRRYPRYDNYGYDRDYYFDYDAERPYKKF
ncbi:hypothetical protein Ciccas_005891 [Cichlidogyrus casuarinus]|uniref:Gag protein n=1 Tax=Cichlidogyrus casuarinus TaxID=1844966 RepID=A0ABD2Q7C4_9PLAT